MLDRFSDTSKQLVQTARELAESHNHSEISNEHLIYAIISQKNSAAWQLIRHKYIPLTLMNRELEMLCQSLPEKKSTAINFDEFFKKTVEKAFFQTESLKYKWISSSLILYGIYESGSETSKTLLETWNFTSESILDFIGTMGDLDGPQELIPPASDFDRQFYNQSQSLNEDTDKILSHAHELAKTYQNPILNFHHLLLSFAFLSSRNVVKIDPLDASQFNLEAVKEIVADKLSPAEAAAKPYQLFNQDVCQIFRIAIEESINQNLPFIEPQHLAMGLVTVNPGDVKKSLGIDYMTMKRIFHEQLGRPEHQSTVKTRKIPAGVEFEHAQISLRRYNADPGAVITIPRKLAEEWGVMALSINKDVLTVAMLDPDDEEVVEKLKELSGLKIARIKTENKDLRAAFKMYY